MLARAKNPGLSTPSRLSSRASTSKERVCGSTEGLIRHTVPSKARSGYASTRTVTACPTATQPAIFSGTFKRARRRLLSTMTMTGVCTFTYCPGLTIRSLTWPPKGARITVSRSFLSARATEAVRWAACALRVSTFWTHS